MRAIFGEECDLAGAPERLNTIGEDFAGPTIAHFGSQAQKRRFLRPILTGEEIWGQLFSEPDSGSDLASLRTKATKAEGGWRIQGPKIWTSRAQLAAHPILLARTGGRPRSTNKRGGLRRGRRRAARPENGSGKTVFVAAREPRGQFPPPARPARRRLRLRRPLAGGRPPPPVAPPRQPGTRYGDRRRLD